MHLLPLLVTPVTTVINRGSIHDDREFVIVDNDLNFCCIYNRYSHRFVSLLIKVQLMNMIGKQTPSINGQGFISIYFDEKLQNKSTLSTLLEVS